MAGGNGWQKRERKSLKRIKLSVCLDNDYDDDDENIFLVFIRVKL